MPEEEIANPYTCYLTNHSMFKDSKIRVVFDASHKDTSGSSLNDFLHVGYNLQKDLLAIIISWCFFKYIFLRDLVKIYRQSRMHPDHIDWLRILWFKSSEECLVLRLLTVTYCTACALFLQMPACCSYPRMCKKNFH